MINTQIFKSVCRSAGLFSISLAIGAFVVSFTTKLALAGAPAHGDSHAGEAAHSGGGGLPQFDFSTYPSQIFWLLVFFGILYYVMSKIALPKMSEIVEARADRISRDLEQAEKLKLQSEEVVSSYEKALGEARAEAHKILSTTNKESESAAAKREAEIASDIMARMRDAEQRIEQAKKLALKNLHEVVVGLTGEMVSKIASVDVNPQDTQALAEQALIANSRKEQEAA